MDEPKSFLLGGLVAVFVGCAFHQVRMRYFPPNVVYTVTSSIGAQILSTSRVWSTGQVVSVSWRTNGFEIVPVLQTNTAREVYGLH